MPSRSERNAKRNHIYQRGTIYHARIDIPEELRPAFGNRRILSKSLKTGDALLARRLASTLVGQWQSQFDSLRTEKLRTGERWLEELHTQASQHRASIDRLLLSAIRGQPSETNNPSRTEEGRRQFYMVIDQLAADGRHDLLREIRDLTAEDAAGPRPVDWIQRYDAWVQRVIQHRTVSQNLLNATEAAEAAALIAAPATYKPKSPISKASQDNFRQYFATQNDKPRTVDVYCSSIKRFSDWLTTNGKELSFDTVAEYLDTVSKVRQTRLSHLAALRKYHDWAKRYDPYYRNLFNQRENPFEKHAHPRVGSNAGEDRKPFTKGQVQQLHSAALERGDADLADLIAFGVYTGCRLEEIGRIRQEMTIDDESGEPIAFLVDDSKSPDGVRQIPIHPDILAIYKRRLAAPQGVTGALFPGNDSTKYGNRLNSLQQRFSKLKVALGFKKDHVFHSLRATFAEGLRHADVNELVIISLIGHKSGTVTFDVYARTSSMKQKREAIEKLAFELAVSA